MTVPSTTRRAGPFTGTGALTSYPFTFKVFAKEDLAVTVADEDGLESTLVLDSSFLVTLNGDQETTPGGSVQYAVSGIATALPAGYSLAITGEGLEYEQTADLPQGGNFNPVVIENALDRQMMLTQLLRDTITRALQLSVTTPDGVDATLPTPVANNFIGWDSAGSGLRNIDPNTLATIVAFASWQSETFSGTGAQTQFTLAADPGSIANTDVSVGGVTQRPNIDYTLSGLVITFTTAPYSGTNNILVRYGQALPEGTSTLEADLLNTADAAKNDALVGVQWTGTPGVATTQHQLTEDRPTMMMALADPLKAAIRALSSTTDVTTQVQSYLQYCYDNKKEAIFPAGQFSIQPVVVTCSGGNFEGAAVVRGTGQNMTRFRKIGSSASPLITYQSTSPGSGVPVSIQGMFTGFTIDGVNETGPGIRFSSVAAFHMDNVGITDTSLGIDILSSLIATFTRNKIVSNAHGIRSRRDGASGTYCNFLTFRSNQITNTPGIGMDIGASDTLNLYDNQFEECGTNQSTATVTISNATPAVVTWASHGLVAEDPVIFTTTGALPTGLTADLCYYVSATGLSAGSFQVSKSPGGSSVATSSAGSGTHTASSPRTGALVIRKTCVDELGSATFNLHGNRFEGNRGSDIRTEYMPAAFGGTMHIAECQMAGTNDGPMILADEMRRVQISHAWAPVGTSTWNIAAEFFDLSHADVITLKRPRGAFTVTTVINSRFNGTFHATGETNSYTTTLTGCTTSPTASVTYNVQGYHVTLTIPAITGASNTTAATLTGMPEVLWPRITKGFISKSTDNGVEKLSEMSIGTNGVITLFNALTSAFTASGTKGHSLTNGVYSYTR